MTGGDMVAACFGGGRTIVATYVSPPNADAHR